MDLEAERSDLKDKLTVLVCGYFAKNFGDDLFFKILFDRYRNVRWELFTRNRDYEDIFANYENVGIIRLLKGFKMDNRTLFIEANEKILHYRKYAAILNIGGSIFMEHTNWEQQWSDREKLLRGFKKRNKKAFIVGANFGPYRTKEFKDKYRELLSQYDDVCFRDRYSYSIFSELAHIRQAPDVVFNLAKEHILQEKCVGISLINLSKRAGLRQHSYAYNRKIVELAEKYMEVGYNIKLFSFCEREGDLLVAERMKAVLIKAWEDRRVRVVNYEGDINTVLREFSSCEVVVGTRFHSIILALLSRQSLLPIIYSDKTYNVLKDIKMHNYCYHIENITNMDVSWAMSMAARNRLTDERPIREAEKQFTGLDRLLECNSPND